MNSTLLNPLLDFSGLPRFSEIKPEDIESDIDDLLYICNAALTLVTEPDFPPTWNELAHTLDVTTERLSRAWGMVTHLHAVMDSPELREAYTQTLPTVTEFWTRLGSDEKLYAKYKAIDTNTLTSEQKRAHALLLRNFVLSGAELTGEAKARFAHIQERQAQLTQQFSEHVMDATDSWQLIVNLDELDGVPSDVIEAAREAAQSKGETGYLLTLRIPCYLPVMQFTKNSNLREKIYRAYSTRASDQSAQTEFDNSACMKEILQLRHEEAQLLGYQNFAQVSLATKMAESEEQVIQFLRHLAQKAKPSALIDLKEIREFASQELGIEQLKPWDFTFISEKLKEKRYAFSEQEVKQYFTAPKVLEGLFKIVETLFEVSIRLDEGSTWHPDVRLYRIERDSQLVGQFYLDPSARNAKRGGAWMDDVRSRWLRPDNQQLQTPVAHLVCNFAPSVGSNPPLLTHDDVITLFHEFGHGLHHLLTQINERDVAGISGVEWDAVELPSQFMENFCWEWSVIRHMTAHVETQESLPRALFEKMLAAKNFQSGLQTLRQIEFSLTDILLHMRTDACDHILEIVSEVRQEVAVIVPPDWNRSIHSFGHIFAGGYAAGYYSYKWAEVLSADAYSAFEETALDDGSFNPETGRQYRQSILEVGGSRSAMESFKAFRGREPTINALLRHQGMQN